jgi:simple sugar transport system ATP-binding protein
VSAPVQAPELLSLQGVTVDYGNIRAIDEVSVGFSGGVITGIVGDNGAGKSTLVKTLSGVVRPTRGSIFFEGQQRRWGSAIDARRAGLETVYQDLALQRGLSLWRNFFVGRELTRRVAGLKVLDRSAMRRICFDQVQAVGLTRVRSADEPVDILSGGERQTLAVARAMYFGSRLLLLDEPMSSLAPKERDHVTTSMRRARDSGLCVIVIDHNVAHVHENCDRIVAVHMGHIVLDCLKEDISLGDLLALVSGGPSEVTEEVSELERQADDRAATVQHD